MGDEPGLGGFGQSDADAGQAEGHEQERPGVAAGGEPGVGEDVDAGACGEDRAGAELVDEGTAGQGGEAAMALCAA